MERQPDSKLFLLGSVFLTILIGLLIPSVFIAASPQEYVDVSYFHNPLWYIVNSFCMAAGMFLIWMRVFYWLAGTFINEEPENENTDEWCLSHGIVSIVPVLLERTYPDLGRFSWLPKRL